MPSLTCLKHRQCQQKGEGTNESQGMLREMRRQSSKGHPKKIYFQFY